MNERERLFIGKWMNEQGRRAEEVDAKGNKRVVNMLQVARAKF